MKISLNLEQKINWAGYEPHEKTIKATTAENNESKLIEWTWEKVSYKNVKTTSLKIYIQWHYKGKRIYKEFINLIVDNHGHIVNNCLPTDIAYLLFLHVPVYSNNPSVLDIILSNAYHGENIAV